MELGPFVREVLREPATVGEATVPLLGSLINNATKILRSEPPLIELEGGKVAFVGDTHGDFDATVKVYEEHFTQVDYLVFLGDYVDRGSYPVENMNFLLALKYAFPKNVLLLRGNHEAYSHFQFSPHDFNRRIEARYGCGMHEKYSALFDELPLMVKAGDIFAAHGGVPKASSLEALKLMDKNDEEALENILWGDIEGGGDRGVGRVFKPAELDQFLQAVACNVFIRSHQPWADDGPYKGKCLTIFTSGAYGDTKRQIALADTSQPINSSEDIKIIEI